MTTTTTHAGIHHHEEGGPKTYLNHETGVWSWLSTLDHKRIGVMYLVGVCFAFLLGGVFVWAGADHFRRFAEVSAKLQERGFIAPRLMLAAGSLVEIAAGLCLAVGFHVAWAAAALIVFTIAASATLLDFWRHDGVQETAEAVLGAAR